MGIKIIQNDLFFEEVVKRTAQGERVRIRGKGNSMLPMIRDGKDEIILEKPNEQSFQKGRLLLAQLSDGQFVLHRVKEIDHTHIILQGDGNLAFTETCTVENIIAEATTVIKGGKAIKVGSVKWKMYRYLWPESYLLRRIALGIYRRI